MIQRPFSGPPRRAKPVDGPVPANQRHGLAIADDGVVFDALGQPPCLSWGGRAPGGGASLRDNGGCAPGVPSNPALPGPIAKLGPKARRASPRAQRRSDATTRPLRRRPSRPGPMRQAPPPAPGAGRRCFSTPSTPSQGRRTRRPTSSASAPSPTFSPPTPRAARGRRRRRSCPRIVSWTRPLNSSAPATPPDGRAASCAPSIGGPWPRGLARAGGEGGATPLDVLDQVIAARTFLAAG
jgi:hypothetical protein